MRHSYEKRVRGGRRTYTREQAEGDYMAKSSASGYQSLGNGVFRVGGVATRSAVTGKYVTLPSTKARQPGESGSASKRSR